MLLSLRYNESCLFVCWSWVLAPLQGGVLLPEGSPRFGVWVLASLQGAAAKRYCQGGGARGRVCVLSRCGCQCRRMVCRCRLLLPERRVHWSFGRWRLLLPACFVRFGAWLLVPLQGFAEGHCCRSAGPTLAFVRWHGAAEGCHCTQCRCSAQP